MDLTLFIVIVILIFGIFYGISIISDLRNDIKIITGNKDETNNMKGMIDKIKDILEYLKSYI